VAYGGIHQIFQTYKRYEQGRNRKTIVQTAMRDLCRLTINLTHTKKQTSFHVKFGVSQIV